MATAYTCLPGGQTQSDTSSSKTHPELTTDALPTVDVEDGRNRCSLTLQKACEKGNLRVVKDSLFKRHESVNCRGYHGRTPVLLAARHGPLQVFNFLVSQGCDLSVVDKNKMNVLHTACVSSQVGIIKKLLDSRMCDIDSRDVQGLTPILLTAYWGPKKAFDLLVKEGCNLTAVDVHEHNVLHRACYGGNSDIVEYILSHDILSIESKDCKGRTPLMMAAMGGRIEVLQVLLQKGSNPAAVDNEHNNIIHLVCKRGKYVELINYILSRHIVSIESRGPVGRTPVMVAAVNGHGRFFRLFIKKGCNLTVLDDHKNNILHVACLSGNVNIVQYILLKHIVSTESTEHRGRTPLMFAVQKGHIKVVNFLVRNGCNLTVLDEGRNNILHIASIDGHLDMVKYLITLTGVEGMQKMRNKCCETAAQVAERNGHHTLSLCLKN